MISLVIAGNAHKSCSPGFPGASSGATSYDLEVKGWYVVFAEGSDLDGLE